MEHSFFTVALTFPAVVFSALLAVILIYWLFIILGVLDIDLFSEIAVFSSEEGSSLDFLLPAGLVGAPFIVIISFLTLCAWILSMLGTYYFVLKMPALVWQILAGLGLLFISLWLAAHVSVFLIKPLKPLFIVEESHAQGELVGKTCVISTLRVDEKFGQANYDDKGAGLILSVRAKTPNRLTKNTEVLIVAYDENENTYTVASIDDL